MCCMSCLNMLAINPLLIILFENIFSCSVDFLFILSMISFALQKLLGLISSHLFILAFVSLASGDTSRKNYWCVLCQKNILSMFSFRSFIVSSLKFRSLIHLELIFVCSLRNMHWVNGISGIFLCPEDKLCKASE